MKSLFGISLFALTLICRPAVGQTLKDVPADHWARIPVLEIVSRGIMSAPDSKFSGSRRITRREVAMALAKLAQSLEKGEWKRAGGQTVKPMSDKSGTSNAVTRYQAAWVFGQIAHHISAGLPKSTGKAYFQSVQLPPIPKVTVPRTDPAYEAIMYLAKNKMAPGTSILLKPAGDSVTGKQLAECIGSMIAGINDRLTDEPQNREDIAPPPGRGRPARP